MGVPPAIGSLGDRVRGPPRRDHSAHPAAVTPVTIGAGFLAGGVLGNLISGASDHLAVPNPLLVHTSTNGGIAFNFADAFIITGNVILVLALCTLVIKHRRRLEHKSALAHVLAAAASSRQA